MQYLPVQVPSKMAVSGLFEERHFFASKSVQGGSTDPGEFASMSLLLLRQVMVLYWGVSDSLQGLPGLEDLAEGVDIADYESGRDEKLSRIDLWIWAVSLVQCLNVFFTGSCPFMWFSISTFRIDM